MPTGLVKSMIQASSAASRETRSAMSKITGTVRSALASPPAPVVSWPTQPHRKGRLSSTARAAWPPTLSCSRTVGICHCSIKISRRCDVPGIPVPGEDALGDSGDERQPLLGRIGQHQLIDAELVLQPRDPVNQLGRIS